MMSSFKNINDDPNGSCRQKIFDNNGPDPLEPFSNAQTLDAEKGVLCYVNAFPKGPYDWFRPRSDHTSTKKEFELVGSRSAQATTKRLNGDPARS